MRALALVVVLLASGCVGAGVGTPSGMSGESAPAAPSPGPIPASEPGNLPPDAAPAAPAPASAPLEAWSFAWTGKELQTTRQTPPAVCIVTFCPTNATCGQANCERVRLDVPDLGGAALEVLVRWPTRNSLRFLVAIESPDGEVLAAGRSSILSAYAQLDAPEPGEYVVAVIQTHGKATPYDARARAAPALPSGATEMLPDLVVLPPTDLRIAAPEGEAPEPLGVGKGCTPYEHVTSKPARCLRFSNAVGNAGLGPLEIRLPAAEGAAALAGEERFTQRIYRADGSFRDAAAGTATFHAAHMHWHNAAVETYVVYALDASGARGAAVGDGAKAGICFADYGFVRLDPPRAGPSRYDGVECLAPWPSQSWILGLQPGWFDLYPWQLDDQHADVGSAPDGLYELCAVVNPDGALAEQNMSNNEACTRFRLVGDDVEALDEAPYHAEWS